MSGVLAEWRSALGDDWPWAKSFLRPSGATAAWYPRLTTSADAGDEVDEAAGLDRGYNVVCHDADAEDYVGVCPRGNGQIPLTRGDVAVYELDRQLLGRRVAEALSLAPDFAELLDACHTCRIGARNPMGEGELWAYVASPPGAQELVDTLGRLALRHTHPFLVLIPTAAAFRRWSDVLRQRGGLVAAPRRAVGDRCARAI